MYVYRIYVSISVKIKWCEYWIMDLFKEHISIRDTPEKFFVRSYEVLHWIFTFSSPTHIYRTQTSAHKSFVTRLQVNVFWSIQLAKNFMRKVVERLYTNEKIKKWKCDGTEFSFKIYEYVFKALLLFTYYQRLNRKVALFLKKVNFLEKYLLNKIIVNSF